MPESPFHSGAPRSEPLIGEPARTAPAAPAEPRLVRGDAAQGPEDETPEFRPAIDLPAEDEGPLRETFRSPLLSEDIASKQGNYILSFGFPGSGKTTLHSFLLRYLMQAGPYKTEPLKRRSGGPVDYEVNLMVTEWMRQWQQGRFPDATPSGEHEIRELSFEVQPIKGVRTPLEFSILEISGEMMRTVIPSRTQNPALSRVVRDLLANERIRLVILLLVSPKVHDNDALFMNFMTYLDANLGFDIRQKASLGIVISDPEEALAYLKRHRQGYEHLAELRGEQVKEFVEAFAPTTYRIFYEWPNPKRKMMMRLYVGEVEQRADGPRLLRPDYTSISKLFDWLYHQYTGRRPGLTRWQRLVSWVRA